MRRLLSLLIAFAVVSFAAISADATLIDHGNGLIYDTDLNITWLQDANYAKTSGFDADGFMTYSVATNWVQSVVYNGINNWRLPYTPNPDPTCLGNPYNCSGGEMSHLYHIEGITYSSPGLFFNFVPDHYWYSPGQGASTAMTFSFVGGNTGSYSQLTWFTVMLVHDGDVAAAATVPEPSTLLLLGSGMLGLGLARLRKFRKNA